MPVPAPPPDHALPTRWQAGLFRLKTTVFRARRLWREATQGRPPRLRSSGVEAAGPVLAESRTPLYATETAAEFALQAGKVQNLRVAAARLDGLRIGRGETFSFWRHIGRPTRRRGFAEGRELREGCVVPSVGGGLCQLSNALYAVALDGGSEIVERHAHSRRLPGSAAEVGRDATVFWNYVDLRFRAPVHCRLEVRLTRRELVVCLRAFAEIPGARATRPSAGRNAADGAPRRRELRDVQRCDVLPPPRAAGARGGCHGLAGGWVVAGIRPLPARGTPAGGLAVPAVGRAGGVPLAGGGLCGDTDRSVGDARPLVAFAAAGGAGGSTPTALLGFDEALAARYARGLPPAALHLVVSQTLLPHLWRAGVLGGRTFDVLMTRLPMADLQATLDRAAVRWPDSRTLADFRAPSSLVDAETAALADARRWITPHSGVARLAGDQAEKLAWALPPPPPARGATGRDLLFPASTLSRKGAGEVAAAARALGLRVQLGGPVLEGGDLWRGIDTLPARTDRAGVGAVVLPAWVEHQPRRLLLAAAAGVPVVASEACGLEGVPGVTTVPAGNVDALVEALACCVPIKDSLTLPALA